jgi:putative effector of murein hydrolase LrgA (UPF0299 family)
MEIIVPSAIVGLIVSVVNEVLKITFFKNLGYGLQKLIAFLLVVLGVGIYVVSTSANTGFDNLLGLFIVTLVTSYAIWKTIFKPLELAFTNMIEKMQARETMKKEEEEKLMDKEAI